MEDMTIYSAKTGNAVLLLCCRNDYKEVWERGYVLTSEEEKSERGRLGTWVNTSQAFWKQ